MNNGDDDFSLYFHSVDPKISQHLLIPVLILYPARSEHPREQDSLEVEEMMKSAETGIADNNSGRNANNPVFLFSRAFVSLPERDN